MAWSQQALRAVMAIVAIAVAVRIVFWLLQPVLPWLLGGLALFGLWRVWSWHRGRW